MYHLDMQTLYSHKAVSLHTFDADTSFLLHRFIIDLARETIVFILRPNIVVSHAAASPTRRT
jgi:hypothetical protein